MTKRSLCKDIDSDRGQVTGIYLFRYRADSSTCYQAVKKKWTSEAAKFGDRRKCFESEKTKGGEEVERTYC